MSVISDAPALAAAEPSALSQRLYRAIWHFRFSPNRENALTFCFRAIPDAKSLRTFAGIALESVWFILNQTDSRFLCFRLSFQENRFPLFPGKRQR